MVNRTRLAIAVAALMASSVPVAAQDPSVRWEAATNGVVPAGAVAYGREADGRPQFACRGELRGGTHLGKISAGLRGCSVGYGGREVTLTSYEVLAQASRPLVERSPMTVVRGTSAIGAAAASRARGAAIVQLPTVPSSGGGSAQKRGFDEHGQPYVEERLADGTIKRTSENGVTLISPDGASRFIPNSVIRSNVQPATPPALPDDPARGRTWVERHNDALLDLIGTLVHRDESEMKKFSDGERQAVAGGDLFAQIAYRTRIADFLATER
jgi:uncharacterized protein DUF3421